MKLAGRRAAIAFLAGAIGALPLAAQAAPPSTDIWLVRWEGAARDARNLTDRPGYDNQPSFSPDGRRVLYTSARGGQTDIYQYTLETGVASALTATPESEYSPLIMPDGLAFAVVRVEADSTQRLWAFALDGQIAVPLLAEVRPVGYHAWADTTDVVLFVLGSPPTLQLADTRTGTSRVVARAVGRSLQKVPGRRAVSFVDKSDSTWMIRTFDLATGAITPLAPTLPGREDFLWRTDESLVMADGPRIYQWNRGRQRWDQRADYSALGVSTITRLAASPDGRWLAFVADRPVQ